MEEEEEEQRHLEREGAPGSGHCASCFVKSFVLVRAFSADGPSWSRWVERTACVRVEVFRVGASTVLFLGQKYSSSVLLLLFFCFFFLLWTVLLQLYLPC